MYKTAKGIILLGILALASCQSNVPREVADEFVNLHEVVDFNQHVKLITLTTNRIKLKKIKITKRKVYDAGAGITPAIVSV